MAPTQATTAANQPPPLSNYNLYEQDTALLEAVRREGAAAWEDELAAFGETLGGEPLEWGRLANEHPPVLRTHDRYGERIDEVEFHPAGDAMLRLGLAARVQSLPWVDERPGAHAARATLFMLLGQVEAGVCCPLSMTFAAVPALRAQPELAAEWVPRLTSGEALCGMAMTERQGGSDVRANETVARPDGDGWLLDGDKWFCSAPQSDAFLALAQAPGGLSCFLLERPHPGFRIERLKDKLGNRSNASAEIVLDGVAARLVGEEGRGVRTIVEMVNHTRLDCVLGSAALMRRAVAEATHHAAHRSAFGRLLADQPLMQNVLADLCIESEAATATALRLARAYDEADGPFRRIATAVGKFWVCKRTPPLVAEALECLGGNGYVEESHLPRLFRESPVNSIWEGSGNVNALDVLRALGREPDTAAAFLAEVRLADGADPRLDAAVTRLERDLAEPDERAARRLLELLAVTLQGSLLVRHGSPEVADAFCASRLDAPGGVFGTLPSDVDQSAIVERARPRR
ncbi:MAG TPA: acyl-CoA dehydrogenase family protein [Gaiellaceae bacterium]|nr:acyl-CoA dehydrogenase family protein [Gaiellaceae bacterium]